MPRLSDRSVANPVKQYAEAVGLDVEGFSGHVDEGRIME